MSAQPTPRFTHEEFLDREIQSPFRHEFRQGRIEMMAGGTFRHGAIGANTLMAFGQALADRDCTILGPDVLVHIESASTSTYPDVMVICGSPSYADLREILVDNPSVIVEVLSPSTEGYDRGEKFDAYKQLPSLLEFVLVHQKTARVECFSRRPDGSWQHDEVSGMNACLKIESLGVKIPLSAIYRRMEF
jgi:Uma2 family endonuclease